MKISWTFAPLILACILVPATVSAAGPGNGALPQLEAAATGCADTAAFAGATAPLQQVLGASQSGVSAASGCVLGCYDAEASESFGCAEGERYSINVTSTLYGCCIVGTQSGCVPSLECQALASQCTGFASSCGGSC